MGSGLAVALVGCVPQPPTQVVDQTNVGATAITDYVDGYVCADTTWVSEVAQTFTSGRTGLLDEVSLNARPITPASSPLSISIRLLRSDGRPGDVVLGSGSYSGPGSPPYSDETVDIALNQPAFVFAGLRYALVVSVPTVADCPAVSTTGWFVAGTTDRYATGQLWSRGNLYDRPDWVPDESGTNDLAFRTFVTG